jgi:hypothetical protein
MEAVDGSQQACRERQASGWQQLDRMEAAGWVQLQQVRSHRECRASGSQRLDRADAAARAGKAARPASPKPLSG